MILEDDNNPGRENTLKLATALYKRGFEVRIWRSPIDANDVLRTHGVDALRDSIDANCRRYEPGTSHVLGGLEP